MSTFDLRTFVMFAVAPMLVMLLSAVPAVSGGCMIYSSHSACIADCQGQEYNCHGCAVWCDNNDFWWNGEDCEQDCSGKTGENKKSELADNTDNNNTPIIVSKDSEKTVSPVSGNKI